MEELFGRQTSREQSLQLSQEEFTRRDWSQQGLVRRTVHMKRFEEQVAGTCSKNLNQFEFVGLNVEVEISGQSRNGQGLVSTTCCRDQSPGVCHTRDRRKGRGGGLPTFTAFE